MPDYKKTKELLQVFGYTGEALNLFKKKIEEREIDNKYQSLIGKDERLIKKLNDEERALFDNGWKLFCSSFNDFVKDYKVDYDNFVNNRIVIGKQERKLFKTCIEFYKEKDITSLIEEVSTLSLPKKRELYVVLSVNLNDFVLCSTGNPWTSCLDLRSGQYAGSVLGYLLDKNRAMIYISDLSEKNYFGVKSHTMFNRMWCLLDKKSSININISYPTKETFPSELVSYVSGFEVKNLSEGFESKYAIEPLFNDNDVFTYGYQDFTNFKSEKDLKLVYKNDNGCFAIRKDFYGKKRITLFDNLYMSKTNIGNLIEENRSMKDFFFQKCSCGKRNSRVLLINKEIVCKDCFDNNKFTCCECGKSYKKKFITTENKTICSNCKSEYTKCKKCGRYFEGYGDDICEECYVNEAKQCVSCGKDDNSIDLSLSFYIGEDRTYKQLGTGMVCYECFEAMCEEYELDFCDECGTYYSRALGRCPDCYK